MSGCDAYYQIQPKLCYDDAWQDIDQAAGHGQLMRKKARWVRAGICVSIVVTGVLLFSYRVPLLLRAGSFMAPRTSGTADVIILEGAGIVETGAVHAAIERVSAGKGSRVVVVLHLLSHGERLYGLDEDYPDLVRKKLVLSGLTEQQVMVIATPAKAPKTLNEAAMVLEALSKEGVRHALLLAKGFHARRSFLVYQHVGRPLGIRIISSAYFNDYQLNDWWTHHEGVEDFATEVIKLLYYQVRGYIPLKYSY